MARSTKLGASAFGDTMAGNITEQGLKDNAFLGQEDSFWDEGLLNPAGLNPTESIEPWLQTQKMPWQFDEYPEETEYNPYGSFMQPQR